MEVSARKRARSSGNTVGTVASATDDLRVKVCFGRCFGGLIWGAVLVAMAGAYACVPLSG
jgi:hypothetical protein